jgi:hypothetical protein
MNLGPINLKIYGCRVPFIINFSLIFLSQPFRILFLLSAYTLVYFHFLQFINRVEVIK